MADLPEPNEQSMTDESAIRRTAVLDALVAS
jgi:hypothetical protein